MLIARRMVIVLVAVWSVQLFVGFSIQGLDALGLELGRTVVLLLLLVAALLGLLVGVSQAKDVGRWTADDIRDGAIGWGVIAGLLVAIPAVALVPVPWNIAVLIAALLAVAALAALLRRNAERLGVSGTAPSRVDRDPRVVDRSA